MPKKVKLEVNDNLFSIFNYINSNESVIKYKELIQYCIDYDLYIEFYLHLNVIDRLVIEHNKEVINKIKKSD